MYSFIWIPGNPFKQVNFNKNNNKNLFSLTAESSSTFYEEFDEKNHRQQNIVETT